MARLGSRLGLTTALLFAPLVALAQTPVPDAPSRPDREQAREARQSVQNQRTEGAGREARGGGRGRGEFQVGGFQGGGFQGGDFQGGRPQRGGGLQVQGGGFRAMGAPVAAPASAAPAEATPPAPATAMLERSPVAGDALSGLSSKVAAVLDISTTPRLLINENDHGVLNTVDLAVGDEYRDGWRLASVNATSVTMRRGEEQRQVALAMNTGIGRAAGPGGGGAIAGAGAGAPAGNAGLPGRGALSLSNGAQSAAASRDGAVQAAQQGQDLAALAGLFGQRLDPAQAQALSARLQVEMQRAMADIPPEVRNDPRAAAAITAMRNGDFGSLLGQVQSALGPNFTAPAPGGGGAEAPTFSIFGLNSPAGGRGQ